MNRVINLRSLSRLFGLTLGALLLGACASQTDAPQPSASQAPAAFSALEHSAPWYLEKAANAQGAEVFNWQMLAARSYLGQGKRKATLALLKTLAASAQTPLQQAKLQLLKAQVLLKEKQHRQALNLLEAKPAVALSPESEQAWYSQRAALQLEIKNLFGAAKSLLALDEFLTGEAQSHNRQQIWSLLKGLPPSTLRAYQEAPAPDATSGWLELAAVMQEYGDHPAQLVRQFGAWQAAYPNHIAAQFAPASLSSLAAGSNDSVRQVAVFLPLSGNLEPQGSAIRNGMLMAYKAQQLPFGLNFYDTQSKSMAELYQQAINEGANLIIGPLLKEWVSELLALQPTIPVLALNELDSPIYGDKLYYFSLSAAADAAQAASDLYQKGYRKPLVIAAQGRIGNNSSRAFTQAWASLSSTQPVIATFAERNQVQGMVRNALSGRTARAGEIQAYGSEPQAIDVVYVVANHLEMRMIKPYVDISVNPMGSLPIYTSARGFDSTAKEVTTEINGLHIANPPLLGPAFSQQREQIALLWPELNSDLLRMFAMGYDALLLADHLPRMRQMGTTEPSGMSGQLSIDSKGNIIRGQIWQIYQNGQLLSPEGAPQEVNDEGIPSATPATVPAPVAPSADQFG
ncbi:MAG: penicillin-binding protein activator [Aeromonas sp.]